MHAQPITNSVSKPAFGPIPVAANEDAIRERGHEAGRAPGFDLGGEPGFDALPTGFHYTALPAQPVLVAAATGPRMISRENGRALETLAHAVEYLQDEMSFGIVRRNVRQNHASQVQAIDLLKQSSRQLWASLPVRQPLWKRWLGRGATNKLTNKLTVKPAVHAHKHPAAAVPVIRLS